MPGESARSALGRHQIGVRWKTVRCATFSAMVGMIWTADAPVPMTATRLPVRSTPASQRAVWIVWPAKSSNPGISGRFGTVSTPVPSMMSRTRQVSPSAKATSQRSADSTNVAAVTLRPKCARSGSPCATARSSA